MTYCLWICLTNLSPATIQLGQASPTRVLGNKFGCSILLKDSRLAEDLANFPWDNHALHKQEFIRLENVNTHRSCCMPSTAIMYHDQTGRRQFVREPVFAGRFIKP